MIHKDTSYWETCCHWSDKAVDELMERFLNENLSPKQVFQELRNIAVDFYPECDIAGETNHKVMTFIKENSMLEMDEIETAFVEVADEATAKIEEARKLEKSIQDLGKAISDKEMKKMLKEHSRLYTVKDKEGKFRSVVNIDSAIEVFKELMNKNKN